jgi:hypothetical protein
VYRLNYYYYGVEEVFPYKVIDLTTPTITYSVTGHSATFSMLPLTVRDFNSTPIKGYKIKYQFYFANSKDSLLSYTNCHLGVAFARSPDLAPPALSRDQAESALVKFTLESDDLPELKETYFVGAEAQVELIVDAESHSHYPRHLKMVYDSIQMSNPRLQGEYFFKDLALWTVLPFLLAGVALVLALRYCIVRYKGMVPDNLVEEEAGPSQSGEAVNVEKNAEENKGTSETMKHDAV